MCIQWTMETSNYIKNLTHHLGNNFTVSDPYFKERKFKKSTIDFADHFSGKSDFYTSFIKLSVIHFPSSFQGDHE